ncbi:YbaB/EbfC family nucleoid-associated protein [Actinomadura sp. 6N118]|uniref:YbaB/EbfC family nucleoid-associated protein n=1 Tax=Actinomadura sp. 6N118 TaxID=3375151 RepID=UPI0037A19DC1
MADFSGADLDRMLTDARKTLESMRKGDSAGQPAATPRTSDSGTPARGGEPIEGVGLAADGRVRATVVAGGRLKSVDMDPRAMRLASAELGEQIVVAVNAALDDLRTKAAAAPTDEVVDTAALGKQVEEIQNQSLRQMELITQALNDTISKIGNTRR